MDPERMMERLAVQRRGCVRSSMLGATGGVIATASLIVGVAAAGGSLVEILRAGMIGMIAGAMAMAACQFMAVSGRMAAPAPSPLAGAGDAVDMNLTEVAAIFRARGLNDDLAREVAMAARFEHAALPAGTDDSYCAGPMQAALTTALTFVLGAALPLGFASMFSVDQLAPGVALASLGVLVMLALASARRVGAVVGRGTVQLVGWGAMALALCWLAGRLFDVSG